MNACLLPILMAIFGVFLFLGVAQSDIEMGSDTAVEQAEVAEAEVIAINSASDNAELYILAIADVDLETAEQYVCPLTDNLLSTDGNVFEVAELTCNETTESVDCSFTSDLGILDDVAAIDMRFSINEYGLVCNLIGLSIDGEVYISAISDSDEPEESAFTGEGDDNSEPSAANVGQYIMAISQDDFITAENYVCPSNADLLLQDNEESPKFEVLDLVCTDWDGKVRCTFISDLGILIESTDIEMWFVVDENGLVCDFDFISFDDELLQ